MSRANTILGTIVGRGPGIIYVEEHKTGEVFALDRFSIVKHHLKSGLTEFKQPNTEAQNKTTTTTRPASRR